MAVEVPSCNRCERPSVLYQAWSGTHACEHHLLRSIRRRVGKELRRQLRIPKGGGTLLVAISGGKDSALLLYFLSKIFSERRDLTIIGGLVNEGIEGYRPPSIECAQELCDTLGIELKVASMADDLGRTMDRAVSKADEIGSEFGPCAFCGVFRRRGIERLANETNAFAVALGHNLDDVAQTILMNLQKGDIDRMLRMAPHTNRVVEGLSPRIVPMRTVTELEATIAARELNLPLHHEECPYASRGLRRQHRDMIAEMEFSVPGTRHGLLASADSIREQLTSSSGVLEAQKCGICGAPTSGNKCMPCKMRSFLEDSD